MTIVAISREMGSGGYEIAAAVAKALGFEYVDREILLQAARVHDVSEEKITDVADRHLSLWERFDEEKRRYLIFIEAAYYSFAEKGNVVTAGRGGPFFLRDVTHAVRVRIMAPFDVRVRRVMEREKLDHKAAVGKVRNYDRELAGRIDYLFGLDWTLPENYDLVINTEATPGSSTPTCWWPRPAIRASSRRRSRSQRVRDLEPGGPGAGRHRQGPADQEHQRRGGGARGPGGAEGGGLQPGHDGRRGRGGPASPRVSRRSPARRWRFRGSIPARSCEGSHQRVRRQLRLTLASWHPADAEC